MSLKSTSPNLTTFAQSLSAGRLKQLLFQVVPRWLTLQSTTSTNLLRSRLEVRRRFQGTSSKPVVSASVAGQVISISQAALKPVELSTAVVGTPTETLTLATNGTGDLTATVGGSATPGDVLSIVINDIRFNNGPVTNSYTVKSGDTTTSIASGLNSAIWANLGLTSTSLYPNYPYYPSYAGSVVTVFPYADHYADVTYSKSVTGVPTETLTSSANFNGNSTITVGGTATTGDVVSLTVENDNLPGGEETVTYTVGGGNTTTNIATGLKNAINASTPLQNLGWALHPLAL